MPTFTPTSRWITRLRRDNGEISSWLLIAAGLCAAATAASAILGGTITELATNVGSGAAPTEASVPTSSPGGLPDEMPGDGSPPSSDAGPSLPDEMPGDGSPPSSQGPNLPDEMPGDGSPPSSQGPIDPTDAAADSGRGGDGGDGGRGGDEPTALDSDGDVSANGVDFTIGPYEEPDIHHDNGFLQNPLDPNDPVPLPTRDPTQEEIDYYNDELSGATWGDRLGWVPLDRVDERFGWDNAVPAYRHFLEGEGADRTFNMNSYLNDDPAGQVVEQSLLDDASTATNFALGDLADSGQLPVGEPVSFTITSDPVTTSPNDPFYPYPSTTDWQRTVGGMQVWTSTDVVATRQADGTVDISTVTTIHGEDRYNFNRGQAAIDSGEPDSLRGVLEESGLAQQYTQTGSTERSDERTVELP